MIQTGNLDIPRLHSRTTFHQRTETRWWKHNNLYSEASRVGSRASTTFLDRKQIFSLSFPVFVPEKNLLLVFLPLGSAAFFIYFRSVILFELWKSTNVLSSKPDAGERDEFVYTTECHYQLWLIFIWRMLWSFHLWKVHVLVSVTFLCGRMRLFIKSSKRWK